MKVKLISISGLTDAISALYVSKRNLGIDKLTDIERVVFANTNRNGFYNPSEDETDRIDFIKYMELLVKYGAKHTTLLRYIDLAIFVEGLHRGGQDDWDAHAMRYNNRIVRNSTRLAKFDEGECSDWYKGKIMSFSKALESSGIEVPAVVSVDGVNFIRSEFGYINEEFVNNQDVKRGLYPLSIPSSFIFKVNVCEWAHVYKMRNQNSTANPEVRELCETIATIVEQHMQWFNRDLMLSIEN